MGDITFFPLWKTFTVSRTTHLLSHFGITNVVQHAEYVVAVQRITCYYQLWKIQKFIYSQTNPSPPPSCCIQADIWPVISPSVEETCGHLMTPTGVMHAIAQDGAMTAMTVSFNISLYILCEMRGTFKLLCFWLDNVHCLVSNVWQH